MPVYVDDMFIPFGRMKMCHMAADTEEELHAMADRIGMKREWFQEGSIPHYDVSMSRRKLAVEHGAVEVTVRELVARKLKPRGYHTTECTARLLAEMDCICGF
ncbi:hypothetical protein ES705_18378 [subsurface metagenome]